MRTTLKLLAAVALSAVLAPGLAGAQTATYQNPVINTSLPDPTVIRADDGYFYLYATENIRNVPIYRSADLVTWRYMGTCFTDQTRPQMVPGGSVWAPDINRIGDKYVLYYSKSTWGGEWQCGIGVATADSPTGPFTDHGKLFISSEIGVQNSIDPFYIEDDGHKYLFWDAVNCRTRYDLSKGFCVAGSDTESFLKEKLTYMGLNEQEMNEFIVYWLPLIEHNAYNLISFQGDAYTNSAKLKITPTPDSECRVFMAYVPLENAVAIEPQQLETFERNGFTVVEWGGAEVNTFNVK